MSSLIGGFEIEELCVLYQPEMACDGATILGVESLVRHSGSPNGTGTGAFVRAAEKSGEIDRLGEWVLRRACRDAAAWPNIFVAVNVSPLQFRSPRFVDLVVDAARVGGLPLTRLELEITEGSYFDDVDRAEAELRELRALGVKIALDDFGTGYSSLSYLRRLPLDRVKIDKSFVDDLESKGTAAIVRAVISLARALDLEVTAEGIETREQLDFLRAAGCGCVQGFLFSGPLTAPDVTRRVGG